MELGEAARPREELFYAGRLRLVTATVTPGQCAAGLAAWDEERQGSTDRDLAPR